MNRDQEERQDVLDTVERYKHLKDIPDETWLLLDELYDLVPGYDSNRAFQVWQGVNARWGIKDPDNDSALSRTLKYLNLQYHFQGAGVAVNDLLLADLAKDLISAEDKAALDCCWEQLEPALILLQENPTYEVILRALLQVWQGSLNELLQATNDTAADTKRKHQVKLSKPERTTEPTHTR
jgi:hypothetical protein